MKIRGAVLYEQGKVEPFSQSKPLVVEEVELDGPGSGEVLVKVSAAGLCHSDLSAIAGRRSRRVPTLVGHESAGIVEEVGSGVDDLEPGDHVVMVFVASCGNCHYCHDGRANLCESSWTARANGTLQSGARRMHLAGQELNHYSGISAFAEYAVVSRRSLVKIDEAVSLEHAAVFGCAVMTGVGAVVNTAAVKMGESIAVFGLGGVGLSALLGARAAGASQIVAVDLNESKLSLAKRLGASSVVKADDKYCIEKIKDLTDGGAMYSFEMSGTVKAMEVAYAATARGGTVVAAGLPEAEATFAVPMASHVSSEKRIVGSYMGSCVAQRDIPRFIELYRQGRLPVDELVSKRLSLDQVNEGFDRLSRGESVRDILVFE